MNPDLIVVLIHDWRPSAGAEPDRKIVYATVSPLLERMITHEMGHVIGNLADEYDCSKCPPEEQMLPKPKAEPAQPNVTLSKKAPVSNHKWEVPPLGLFEGAMRVKKGVYRPELNCHMRDTSKPFCRVCLRVIEGKLEKYLQ